MAATKLSKVIVYWIKERGSFPVVSESAVKGEILPGKKTVTKFQGKLFPSLIIAKADPKTIRVAEEEFKEFLDKVLLEESPEDLESCIIQYARASGKTVFDTNDESHYSRQVVTDSKHASLGSSKAPTETHDESNSSSKALIGTEALEKAVCDTKEKPQNSRQVVTDSKHASLGSSKAPTEPHDECNSSSKAPTETDGNEDKQDGFSALMKMRLESSSEKRLKKLEEEVRYLRKKIRRLEDRNEATTQSPPSSSQSPPSSSQSPPSISQSQKETAPQSPVSKSQRSFDGAEEEMQCTLMN